MKTFIVTPMGNSCNLHCDYCYHENLSRRPLAKMNERVLGKFIKESLSLFDGVRYIWHGGESMLAGIDFYKKVLVLQKKYKRINQSVINGIQTNATLVNENWGQIFADNNFYVSTSLDGTKDLHDLHRDNSYDRVVKGIEILSKHLNRVGIILVVNKDNVHFPDEIYKSFCVHNWYRGFELHPCMPIADSKNELVPDENDLLNFMCRIFDLWWGQDDPKIVIRTLRDIIRVFLGVYPITCASQRKGCLHISSIDYDGNIYTCSRFMKEKEGYLGNILEDTLYNLLQSERTQKIYQLMVELPKECLSCGWLNYCGGGCAYQRWLDGWSKYYQCNVRRKVFEYVVSKLQAGII
ncbi:MAG: SPASM domain-containing protein [Candidatus Portnoybacteria bacterium]|nr:SPASM domain-containing protein [Candidatus Portnoybacteria bacterium]